MTHKTYSYAGAVAALVVACGAGYLFWAHGGESDAASGAAAVGAVVIAQAGTAPPPPPGSTITVERDGGPASASMLGQKAPPPEGYNAYTNAKYGFTFYHEPEATVKEYDEGGGALTVALEDYAHQRGLQIFIVPYGEPKISEKRFKEDVPSGVRENVEKTSLDGVEAVTFTSRDAVLGETRELWSIHNGYLYEITTFSGIGNWFAPIIQSWQWR